MWKHTSGSPQFPTWRGVTVSDISYLFVLSNLYLAHISALCLTWSLLVIVHGYQSQLILFHVSFDFNQIFCEIWIHWDCRGKLPAHACSAASVSFALCHLYTGLSHNSALIAVLYRVKGSHRLNAPCFSPGEHNKAIGPELLCLSTHKGP